MMRYQGDHTRSLTGCGIKPLLRVLALASLTVLLARTGQCRDDLHNPPLLTMQNTPRLQVGKATVEQLGSIFDTAAGPFAAARAGDWRISNELITATFAATDDSTTVMRRVTMPTNGVQDSGPSSSRCPGGLIDYTTGGESLDFLVLFTQYAGNSAQGEAIEYDTAQPVKRADAVGLQLEGSPFENSPVRVQTTYWLAPGSRRLQVESKVLNVPEGEKVPEISDAGFWGYGSMLVDGLGMLFNDKHDKVETELVEAQGGNLTLGLVGMPGMKIHGTFIGSPSSMRATYGPPLPAANARTTASIAAGDKKTTATAAGDKKTTATASADQKTTAAVARSDARTTPGAAREMKTTASLVLVRQNAAPTTATNPAFIQRELWAMDGTYGDLLEKIQEDRKVATGTITGAMLTETRDKPLADAKIRVQRIDLAHLKQEPTLYTVIKTDKSGRYSIKLPAGYYFLFHEPRSLALPPGALRTSVESVVNKTKTINLRAVPESGVHVRVLDEATSRPLPARVRVEAIPPTAPMNFGFPLSAAGYVDNAYLPARGGNLYLPTGRWIIYVSHGIEYDTNDRDVSVTGGKMSELVIRLKRSNPTPGWVHIETGVRTKATPGCAIEAKDIVQMAAAEGIQWLITGDFERLTDLRPQIQALGLTGHLGTSRGFRTILPAHPEWGQFLIYPVKDGAPDPATARKEWAKLKSAREFLATLRRLYPGALIQAELAWTESGLGYFGQRNKDAYEVSWDFAPDRDPNIDAVNLFPARRPWQLNDCRGFWINNMIRGRRYLITSSNGGTTVFGAEPGYPRLLARLAPGIKATTEEAIVEALRAHQVQVTSGPFIQFAVNNALPGGMCSLDDKARIELKVTAPKWVDTSVLMLDRENHPKKQLLITAGDTGPLRFPAGEDSAVAHVTMGDLDLSSARDTIVSLWTAGAQSLRPWVPSASPEDEVVPFAMVYPIIVDGKKNGKYDPITYVQQGTGKGDEMIGATK